MIVHVLVEGPSDEAFLRPWLSRFAPKHRFRIIKHRGKGSLPSNLSALPEPQKQGLLDQLPAKLRAFSKILDPRTDRVLVLVDIDSDDYDVQKQRLLDILGTCEPGLVVLFRFAIEETEAFYLGDVAAIRRAFPVSKPAKMKTYVQDSICGTWEVFRDVVGASREEKVKWGRQMGGELGVAWTGAGANKSNSFKQLCTAILRLVGETVGNR